MMSLKKFNWFNLCMNWLFRFILFLLVQIIYALLSEMIELTSIKISKSKV